MISRIIFLACVSLATFQFAACKSHNSLPVSQSLRATILASNFVQYCRQAATGCTNPFVTAFDTGLFVTDFADGRARNSRVAPESLQSYLSSLPIAAWPRGASIVVSRSDEVFSEQRVEDNFNQAVRICKSLGLDVEIRPGG